MNSRKFSIIIGWWPASHLAFWTVLLSGMLTPVGGQEKRPVPPSVIALAEKYDEARRAQLGPLLNLLANEVTGKVVPRFTRDGKAAQAIELTEGAEKLREMKTPLMPKEGMPFPKASFELLQTTEEWKHFLAGFNETESVPNESYQRALDREKASFQQQGDPYGVIAVENEMKRVVGLREGMVDAAGTSNLSSLGAGAGKPAGGMATPTESKPKSTTQPSFGEVADKAKLTARFVGKGFQYYFEREKETVLIFFRRNGEVLRKTTEVDGATSVDVGAWEIGDDGSVEVMGISSPKWFWFNEDGSCQMRQNEKEGARQSLSLVPDAADPQK